MRHTQHTRGSSFFKTNRIPPGQVKNVRREFIHFLRYTRTLRYTREYNNSYNGRTRRIYLFLLTSRLYIAKYYSNTAYSKEINSNLTPLSLAL